MRLSDERRIRLLAGLTAISGLALLAGCSTVSGGVDPSVASDGPSFNGPQADYPVLVGEPYTISGTTFTPSDTLNYDEVGYLAAQTGAQGITGAHHTLPVPSYVEVTSLETGRTILARVEQRGPMYSTHLLALSPAAMAQLGASENSPVRVRRVNPPEEQRAALRAGAEAPLRMDTPMSLVAVLKRQLPPAPADAAIVPEESREEPVTVAIEPEAVATGPEAVPSSEPAPDASSPSLAQSEPEVPAVVASSPLSRGFVVQAAAFSNQDNAERAARALDGMVSPAGRFYRVRTGPFATREEAEGSLAKVRAAGYSDARIFTND